MNCTYYNVFEQFYKNYRWWMDKKARIAQTINNFKSKDPVLKAAAEAQTEVSIVFIYGPLISIVYYAIYI